MGEQPGDRRSDDSLVWSVVATLLAGPAVWGATGYGVDVALGVSVFTPIGIVVGFALSLYTVYARYGRD